MRPGPTRVLSAVLGALLLASPTAAQSPSAAPITPPSPSPAATADPLHDFQDRPGTDATPGGLAWQQVDDPVQARGWRLADLGTWSGGFFVIEWRERPDGSEHAVAIWRSPEGQAWQRALLPRPADDLLGIVPFQDGLALLAVDRRVGTLTGGRAYRVHVWRSPDAIVWREAGSFEDVVPQRYAAGWRFSIGTPFKVNGRLTVPVHLEYSVGAGGLIGSPWGMLGAEARGRSAPGQERLVGWSSTDGTSWLAATMAGLRDLPGPTSWSPTGARALGPTLTETRDGVTWRPIDDAPPLYSASGPSDLLWADGASLVYGDNDDPVGAESCGNRLGVWRLEPDGWVQTLDRQAAAVYDAATAGPTVLLAGWSWCLPSDRDAEWSWILASGDGGHTWDPDTSWVGAPGTCFSEVAIHERTAVLLACPVRTIGEAPHPAFWVAPLP